IDAEASRQATRGGYRKQEPLWRIKAEEEGRLHSLRSGGGPGASAKVSRDEAHEAWRRIAMSLANSDNREAQLLATQIAGFVRDGSLGRKIAPPQQGVQRTPVRSASERSPQSTRSPVAEQSRRGPEMER
ncbi:MAG: conjugal transfer protein TraS, partial [Pseudomonadota bacterium]|nr:conjugal transfer protein TraS [Pseudomonadota bacterium]